MTKPSVKCVRYNHGTPFSDVRSLDEPFDLILSSATFYHLVRSCRCTRQLSPHTVWRHLPMFADYFTGNVRQVDPLGALAAAYERLGDGGLLLVRHFPLAVRPRP
jgi:hypothetical protein